MHATTQDCNQWSLRILETQVVMPLGVLEIEITSARLYACLPAARQMLGTFMLM